MQQTYGHLDDTLCSLEHFFKEGEELVALNMLGHDQEGIDICSWTVNSQAVRAKGKDLAAAERVHPIPRRAAGRGGTERQHRVQHRTESEPSGHMV